MLEEVEVDTIDSHLLKQDGTVPFNTLRYRLEGTPRWLVRRRELCRRHCHSRRSSLRN
jgi:hypothetical protein